MRICERFRLDMPKPRDIAQIVPSWRSKPSVLARLEKEAALVKKRSFLLRAWPCCFWWFCTAWEAFCRLGGIPDFILPPPTRIPEGRPG